MGRFVRSVALRFFDMTAIDRRAVVEVMFQRRQRDTVAFWLQLSLSAAIATLGLVTGSTAVVIGAMLIAPLMGPIVELGMGLVVGSPVLTIRSGVRLSTSLLGVVGGAAVLTLTLPFHEVTAEISARTSPTALDLLLAIFVALAAAFTTARPGSDTTSAAAGTAIGIALVPPLCVVGFGLGVADPRIASGASLLFLTNLTAILVVSVLFFWLLGFDRVGFEDWEEGALASARAGGYLRRSIDATRRIFGARYGGAVRVGLPLLLVGLLVVPLSRALKQVAWEVRARSAVARILDAQLSSLPAVDSRISIANGSIAVHVYVIGSPDEAGLLEQELTQRIAAETGVVPQMRVISVPDAAALLKSTASSTSSPVPLSSSVAMAELRASLDGALRQIWPDSAVGPLLSWRLELPDSTVPLLIFEHLGSELGAGADALLEREIGQRAGIEVRVRSRAYPDSIVLADAEHLDRWLAALDEALTRMAENERLHVCVEVPSLQRPATAARRALDWVRASAVKSRVHVRENGSRWSFYYARSACPEHPPEGGEKPNRPS